MGRHGGEEIAALATYLASDDSGFTTGQFHIIDGGICVVYFKQGEKNEVIKIR